MSTNAKTVRLFLHDGTLEGVIGSEDSGWTGELLVVPRESMDETKAHEMSSMGGLCILLIPAHTRTCPSRDLSRQLALPDPANESPDKVVLLTTQEASLDDADVSYLAEELANKGEHISADISKRGVEVPDAQRKAYLSHFLDEALFLLGIVGIDLTQKPATEEMSVKPSHGAATSASTIRPLPGSQLNKGEALAYLREQGMDLNSRTTSFATLLKGSSHFWVNPRTTLLDIDWNLVLNDNLHYELIILHVPAGTMTTRDMNSNGLRLRTDKPDLIDLQIDLGSLKDRRSGKSFAPYVVTRIAY